MRFWTVQDEFDFLARTGDLKLHINPYASFREQEETIYGLVVPKVKKHLRKEKIAATTELIVDVVRSKHKYLRSKSKRASDTEKISNIRRIKANNRNAEVSVWILTFGSITLSWLFPIRNGSVGKRLRTSCGRRTTSAFRSTIERSWQRSFARQHTIHLNHRRNERASTRHRSVAKKKRTCKGVRYCRKVGRGK